MVTVMVDRVPRKRQNRAERVGRGISKWQGADLGFSVKGTIMEKCSVTEVLALSSSAFTSMHRPRMRQEASRTTNACITVLPNSDCMISE